MAQLVGMDSDAVISIAAHLDTAAQQLSDIIGSTDTLVSRAEQIWQGPRTREFVDLWQSHHRPALRRAHDSVAGLARSARNNAEEQGSASAASGRNASPTAALTVSGLAGLQAFLAAPAAAEAAIRQLGSASQHGTSGEVFRGARGDWSASHNSHGVALNGSASAYAGAGAEGSSHAGIGLDGANASASGRAYAGVGVAALGSATYGVVSASGNASAQAGAEVSGNANAHLGLDGASVSAGGKAFAGASAAAGGSVDIGGVGAGATAEGWIGAGVQADAKASVTTEEIKVEWKFGAALGFGGSVGGSIDIKPAEIAQNVERGVAGFLHL